MEKIFESDKKRIWRPAVTKIIRNFQEALVAIVPVLEKSKIQWRDGQQFDSFDGIAESLFQWIVVDNLESYISEKYNKTPNIAKYNFFYKDYSKIGFIEVLTGTDSSFGREIFKALGSEEYPFDLVYCDKIDDSGQVVASDIKYEFSKVKFRYCHRTVSGELKNIDNIQITL